VGQSPKKKKLCAPRGQKRKPVVCFCQGRKEKKQKVTDQIQWEREKTKNVGPTREGDAQVGTTEGVSEKKSGGI